MQGAGLGVTAGVMFVGFVVLRASADGCGLLHVADGAPDFAPPMVEIGVFSVVF